MTNVVDPYNCTTNPATGLTSPMAGIMSMYRRPLPSTNLGFLSTVMWDGREPSLASQATDATWVTLRPTRRRLRLKWLRLWLSRAAYSPRRSTMRTPTSTQRGRDGWTCCALVAARQFYIGVNDPFGQNPNKSLTFSSSIFDLYKPWLGLPGRGGVVQGRKSVARGEEVFNNTVINITGVAGINDDAESPSVSGFCGTCHDTPNVGDHSVKAPLNIGIADAGANAPPALDISGLPVFTLKCTAGPLAGQTFVVTDPAAR